MSAKSIDSNSGYLIPKGQAIYIFVLLFLLYLFDYSDRLIVSSLVPFLKAEWGISDAQAGMMTSVVYWAIVIFAFPVSILIDRWSRKNSIAIMATVWCVATALCAFVPTFAYLLIARALIGVGEAGYAPGGTAMIATIFPPKKRSFYVGLWSAAIPLGAAVGVLVGGIVAKHWGWRHAFGLVALPGLIISIMFFFVKDYKTVELKDESKSQKLDFKKILKQFSSNATLIYTFLGFAFNTFVTTALLHWLPSYYNRVEHLPEDKAGTKASIIMIMTLFGAPLGGWLADKWGQKNPGAKLHFSALTSFLAGTIFFCAFYFASGAIQYGMLLVGGIVMIAFLPGAAAVTQEVVHPGLRATAYSLCVVVQNGLGSGLGPVVTGFISDMKKAAVELQMTATSVLSTPETMAQVKKIAEAQGIHLALTLLPLMCLGAAVFFYLAQRSYDRDLAKVAQVKITSE